MHVRSFGLLVLLLVFEPAFAVDGPPSDASLHELLEVMHTHGTLDAAMNQMDGVLRKSMQQAMAGRTPDAGEQKIFDEQRGKLKELMQHQLAWGKMEPTYIEIYRKTFSQKEVNDMLVFYKSPSGQAVVAKMPVLMHQITQSIQDMMGNLMPELLKINQQTTNELKAYEANKQGAQPHS